MNLIHHFDSLEHMNNYYQSIFDNNDSIIFLGNLHSHANDLFQMSQKIIDEVMQSDDSFYLYPFSKTSFRKNIHPFVVNSTYKAFVNSLKNNSYIIELSGSNVILKKKDLTQEVYDSYFSQINLDFPDINNYLLKLSTKISNLEADIEFYKNHINDLQTLCSSLYDQLSQANEQIYNKTISTWY